MSDAPRNILLALDLGAQTQSVVERCLALPIAPEAHIWVLHVAAPDPDFVGYDAGPETVRQDVARGLRAEHRQIQEVAESIRERGFEATALLIQGPTVESILAEAGKLSAELIVVGTHSRGAVMRTLLGSTSEGVVRQAEVPVLVVPDRARRHSTSEMLKKLAPISGVLALVLLLGCASESMRHVLYPPDFQYISRGDLRGAMGELASLAARLDYLARSREGIDTHGDEVASILREMEGIASRLNPGDMPTNHPLVNANLPRLRDDIFRARLAAERTPPSFERAAAVPSACLHCHSRAPGD